MNKEELETREKLKLTNIAKDWLRTEHSEGNVQSLVNLILSFTEPREKQIQIDAEQIRALQKQNGELTDKEKELEAQNEKIENYFVESAGYGRDKVRNFMDIVNKALEQKGERITELEAQIEKMKSCRSCKHDNHCNHRVCDKSLPLWEFKEIKEND